MKRLRQHLEIFTPDGISINYRSPITQYNVREFYGDSPSEITRNLPLWVKFAHEEHCFDKYYRKREKSDVFSIEFVLEGSMLFAQEENEYCVNPGEVFLVHLDRDNEFTTGPEKHCHRLACSLKGHNLNSILQTTGIYEKDVIRLNDAKMFEMLMRDCFITMKNRHPGFRKRASAIAYQLLLELGNCIMLESQPELLVRAVEIMENHLSQRLSLSRLAELLNSSHSSLNRIFKATYKQTPIDHFIQMKMDMAKSMLINTNLQIQEIAERVGYDNALYFSTEFRKKIGVSPRKFRKNIPSNQKN